MAMYENSELMDKEVERLIKKLDTLEPTSDDYKTVRASLTALYELRNTQYKIEIEDSEKRDKSEAELRQKADELEVRKSELESADRKNENDAQQKRDDLEFKQQELAVREREVELAEKRLEFEERQKKEENDLRAQELQMNEQQHKDCLKSQKKDRIANCAITAVNVVKDVLKMISMVGVTMYVAREGYKFEETGTPTSKTFREELKGVLDIFKKS